MYKLFLDIGNSSVKWASVIDSDYQYEEPIALDLLLSEGLNRFEVSGTPDEVYISTVADAGQVDQLKSMIQQCWQVIPVVLSSQRDCCGLTNGYEHFSQLGDDRWFAMQGAIGIYKLPSLVIDSGTALTIDAIIEGVHQGGFIVPGLATMRHSLSLTTADLADYSQAIVSDSLMEQSDQILAANTESAILGGTLYMTAAFLNQLISDLNNQFSTQFKVVLTGGESVRFANLIDYEFDYIPDLVLQGMVNVVESVKKV